MYLRPVQDTLYSGVLQASGKDVAMWLKSDLFEEHLFSYFPCTNVTPSIANQVFVETTLEMEMLIITFLSTEVADVLVFHHAGTYTILHAQ